MPKVVIADASCLIILSKIGELELLHLLYDRIYITSEVEREFGEALPDWIIIETVEDKEYQKFLEAKLDVGEASAIALARSQANSLIVLDDLKARKIAKEIGIVYTGTLGIISKAKEEGHCEQIKPIIQKILQTNFRISKQVVNALLSRHGEEL
jgi:predicted nucleic acid-binding protein